MSGQGHADVSLPLLRNCLAAGSAAAIATGTFNPMDTLRVRWQVIAMANGAAYAQEVGAKSFPLLRYAKDIVAKEGLVSGLWRPGVTATMTSMFTATSIRMGSYPFLRDWVAGGSQKTPVLMFGTGLIAGAVGYWASCPVFQAKTRLQAAIAITDVSTASSGMLRQLDSVVSEGGVSALWRGSTPLVVRGAFLGAGQSLGYDGTKTVLSQRNQIMDDGPILHVFSSVVASFLATTMAAPADYVMTRYQAAFQFGAPFQDPAACLRHILYHDGVAVLYRGWSLSFVRMTPVFMLFSTLWEQFRAGLGLGYLR